MGKRKRQAGDTSGSKSGGDAKRTAVTTTTTTKTTTAASKSIKSSKTEATSGIETCEAQTGQETIQIITGSYDQILHGFTATMKRNGEAVFADTFLFHAHGSAIRCVAVSPPSEPATGQRQKVLLASGSTDERINIYSLSAHPPSHKGQDMLAKVAPRPILENRKNREVGTLLHHASTITALQFPTRSKLLSSSEDSTISVTRTRDWSVLSSIKVPAAKAQGRPSGDTAALGATPSGVNDLAVHPSMKLMISVSKGERCMRLWNLVTGKKAGVLSFGREMLQEIGEGKHSTGEGRRVVWGSVEGLDEFAVGFDRDVVVFGMDSIPKCRLMAATARSKLHGLKYVAVDEASGLSLVAVSTEDGRILFFSTRTADIAGAETGQGGKQGKLATARLVGYVGGREAGIGGRIKDFVVVRGEAGQVGEGDGGEDGGSWLYLVGGSSEGKVRVWRLRTGELAAAAATTATTTTTGRRLGELFGTYETQSRITCMAAYLMVARAEGEDESEDGDGDGDGDEDEDEDGDGDGDGDGDDDDDE